MQITIRTSLIFDRTLLLTLMLIVSLASASAALASESRGGRLYAVGKTSEAPLYNQKLQIDTESDGSFKLDGAITDSQGKVMLTEKSTGLGANILTQRVDQMQTDESWELEVKESKIHFHSFKVVQGKRVALQDKTEDVGETFITGPTTEPYLRSHWAELLKGDTLYVRFGVLELGFAHFKP